MHVNLCDIVIISNLVDICILCSDNWFLLILVILYDSNGVLCSAIVIVFAVVFVLAIVLDVLLVLCVCSLKSENLNFARRDCIHCVWLTPLSVSRSGGICRLAMILAACACFLFIQAVHCA